MSLTPMKIHSVRMIEDALAPVTGEIHHPWNNFRTFQAVLTGTAGAGAATVVIEASDEDTPTHWVNLATLNLAAAFPASDSGGFASDAAWRFVRARLTSIAGVNAAVNVWMGA